MSPFGGAAPSTKTAASPVLCAPFGLIPCSIWFNCPPHRPFFRSPTPALDLPAAVYHLTRIMNMRRSKTSSPSFPRALHATAMFCATVSVLLLVSRAAGTAVPLERASYRPVDQGLATPDPESYNRTRRQVRRVHGNGERQSFEMRRWRRSHAGRAVQCFLTEQASLGDGPTVRGAVCLFCHC